MKELLIAAGSYSCTWFIGNDRVCGDLQLTGARGPKGAAFEVPGAWTDSSTEDGPSSRRFRPHTVEMPVLRGRLRSGHDVSLVDAKVRHIFPEQSEVTARMALCGRWFPLGDGELMFSSVEFQVGGLTELAGVSPVKDITLPAERQDDPTISATWDSTAATQTWTTATGDEVSLEFVSNIKSNLRYSISLASSPVIKVSGAPRMADDWMRDYVRPTMELATLATGRKQPVSWVVLVCDGEEWSLAQLFASEVTQEPYVAESPDPTDLGALIHLGPDGATLPDLLVGWRQLETKYDTFFEYLTTAMREQMSVKSWFLALVPALEAFHTEKHGDGPMTESDFKRQRKDVLARIKALSGVRPEDVAWLKKWVKTIGSYELAYRLREVVEKDLPAELRARIQARTTPLPAVLEGIVKDATDVWQVMAKARNRMAHGEPEPTRDQLRALTRLAHTVTIGLALQQLGVPDTDLTTAIDHHEWHVY